MLIKVITTNNDTVIIDGVTDVMVKGGLQSYKADVPQEDGYVTLFFDADENSVGVEYVVKEITYAKDGPCRVLVANRAYVCNDDGKTIEKVIAGAGTV